MASRPCANPSEQAGLILDVVTALRGCPRYREAMLVFMVEGNLGMEHQHIRTFIDRHADEVGRRCFMSSERNPSGFTMTAAAKQEMYNMVYQSVYDKTVRLCTVTADMGALASETGSTISQRANRARLMVQLANYSRTVNERTGAVRYTGKMHGPDDLSIVFQMLPLAHSMFMTSDKYRHLIGRG